MTLSSRQVVPHLSPRWDTGGLCSTSPINPTLIKAFCLMKWAAWETLWKRSYHLEAATGKGGGCHTLNSSESQREVLEPFRKQRIPSKDRSCGIWFNGQKAFLWQDAVGNAQTGTDAHGNSGNRPGWPLGICLSPLFTSLPDFYSTRLHHVRVTLQGSGQSHTNRRHLHPEATISWTDPPTPRNGGGGQDRREMGAVVLCPLLSFCTIFFGFQKWWK